MGNKVRRLCPCGRLPIGTKADQSMAAPCDPRNRSLNANGVAPYQPSGGAPIRQWAQPQDARLNPPGQESLRESDVRA